MKRTIGYDAKRIVSNNTGLGSYGRTLVNDLIRRADPDVDLLLYAPTPGRDDLRQQILLNEHTQFRYPDKVQSSKFKVQSFFGVPSVLSMT